MSHISSQWVSPDTWAVQAGKSIAKTAGLRPGLGKPTVGQVALTRDERKMMYALLKFCS